MMPVTPSPYGAAGKGTVASLPDGDATKATLGIFGSVGLSEGAFAVVGIVEPELAIGLTGIAAVTATATYTYCNLD